MKVETNNLRSVKSYADLNKVSTVYIYNLIKKNLIKSIVIDGVTFVDVTAHPKLPTRM